MTPSTAPAYIIPHSKLPENTPLATFVINTACGAGKSELPMP